MTNPAPCALLSDETLTAVIGAVRKKEPVASRLPACSIAGESDDSPRISVYTTAASAPEQFDALAATWSVWEPVHGLGRSAAHASHIPNGPSKGDCATFVLPATGTAVGIQVVATDRNTPNYTKMCAVSDQLARHIGER